MHDIRPEKAGKVAELKDLLSSSKGAVLVDYCGLTVAEDTELRSKMREAGVKYMVAKNTFIRIAAKEAGIEGLDAYLEHNTAVAFSAEDPVAPAKILNDFSKDHKALESKPASWTVKLSPWTKSRLWQNCLPEKNCWPNWLAACRPPFPGWSTYCRGRSATLCIPWKPYGKRKSRNLLNRKTG